MLIIVNFISQIFHSVTLLCIFYSVLNITANVTRSRNKLPEIKYGMTCVFGKMYKMGCNTCRCGLKNTLLCTKVACLKSHKFEITEDEKKKILRTGEPQKQPHEVKTKKPEITEIIPNSEEISLGGKEKRKRVKKIIGKANKRILRTDTGGFPELPPSRNCEPGRIYQESCHRCYCKFNRQPLCSSIDSCIQPTVTRDLVPEDIRPVVKDKEFHGLPSLAHTAAACVPGITYKVECNVCLCDEFKNLICDKLLCISFADMHRMEAMQKTGLACNADNYQENDVIQSKCVECSCNGTTYCQAKENCIAEKEYMMRSYETRRNGSRLTFDYNVEKCLPDHIYKDNCNKCYCQKDQTLRCTQKTCLNYNQAVILEKQQEYLQRHGL